MTLPDPTNANWNMDTGASSHLNSNATNLSTLFNSCMYPSVLVSDGKSIPVTNTGHSTLPTLYRPLHLNNLHQLVLGSPVANGSTQMCSAISSLDVKECFLHESYLILPTSSTSCFRRSDDSLDHVAFYNDHFYGLNSPHAFISELQPYAARSMSHRGGSTVIDLYTPDIPYMPFSRFTMTGFCNDPFALPDAISSPKSTYGFIWMIFRTLECITFLSPQPGGDVRVLSSASSKLLCISDINSPTLWCIGRKRQPQNFLAEDQQTCSTHRLLVDESYCWACASENEKYGKQKATELGKLWPLGLQIKDARTLAALNVMRLISKPTTANCIPEFQDTASNGQEKEAKVFTFYRMEEEGERYFTPCYVGGLHAYDGEINLKYEKNLISNEFAVKLCLEYEEKNREKLVKRELLVSLKGEFYFVKFIVNPEEDDVEPNVILGRSFMRLAKGIADFRNGIITIHPELGPFLDNSEETGKFEDDCDHLLDINFGNIPEIDEAGLPPFPYKMGKSKRNKKRELKNFQIFYSDVGPSLLNGKPLTQEEASREALAIDICKRFSILEEERPVIETMTYSDK
ncbi:hypothetical protein Tco_1175142, partial [Tanacetum coccineum]